MFKEKIVRLVKIFLTKIGLKPIILSFLHSKLWREYLYPIIFFLRKLPLRIKYYQLFRINKLVPTSHLVVLNIIQKLTKIYEPYGVKFFLSGGLLLGAVRQQSFAGDPGDVDLGLTVDHFDIFYKHIDLLEKNFKTRPIKPYVDKKNFKISDPDFKLIHNYVKKWTEKENNTFYRFELNRLQFMLEERLVDIDFFALKNIDGKKYWVENSEPKSRVRYDQNELLKLDKIKVYGLEFYSPQNPKKYLDIVFGQNWKIPNKKQFIWKKNYN